MNEYFVTFGVKYTKHPASDRHPLRMQSKGFAVIEADDLGEAQALAQRTFGVAYAFVYDRENFIDDGTAARWHHDGALMRIKQDGSWSYVNERLLQPEEPE